MAAAIEQLLRHPSIWRAGADPRPETGYIATGWDELDRALPGGGWPRGAITEILLEQHGIGELGLLLPALSQLTQQALWAAWVAPPLIPYAPALHARGCDLSKVVTVKLKDDAQALWAAEQLLHTQATGAVLLWTQNADERRLRRLQLAAETGTTLAVIFRPAQQARRSSPAALRLMLNVSSSTGQLNVEVLKCRGRLPARLLRAG
ncbi:MAG: SOS cell division inhibitor SulA [Gammaproteobacteria bacterium]|nr:SOS cell division inhibitor SulA [Gammaproteobacteria bacterium]